MRVFHFGKSVCFFIVFFSLRASQPTILTFKSTGVEDTHLTLAVISFNVGVNNSFNVLPLQTYKKQLPSFRSCRIYSPLVNSRNLSWVVTGTKQIFYVHFDEALCKSCLFTCFPSEIDLVGFSCFWSLTH